MLLPFEVDIVFLASISLLLFFVLGAYVFVRKVLLGFREGIEEGRR